MIPLIFKYSLVSWEVRFFWPMAGRAPPHPMHFRGEPQRGPADCTPIGIWSALVVFGSSSSGLSISGMGTPGDSLKKGTPKLN